MPSRFVWRTVDTETGEIVEIWFEHRATRSAGGQRAIVLEPVETRTIEPERETRNG